MAIASTLYNARMYGTNAERLALVTTDLGTTEICFYETDTGSEYSWKGSEWVQVSTDGAKHVTQATLTAGEDQTNDVVKVEQRYAYETVAASQTAQVLGATGAVNDFLHKLICVVNTSATSAVTINDGGGAEIPIIPANAPIGTYPIPINHPSVTGSWRVTTAAGVTVLAGGRFS